MIEGHYQGLIAAAQQIKNSIDAIRADLQRITQIPAPIRARIEAPADDNTLVITGAKRDKDGDVWIRVDGQWRMLEVRTQGEKNLDNAYEPYTDLRIVDARAGIERS